MTTCDKTCKIIIVSHKQYAQSVYYKRTNNKIFIKIQPYTKY